MSAEHIEKTIIENQVSPELSISLGELALVSPVPATVPADESAIRLPLALSEAGEGARKIGVAATLIKERFQGLSSQLKAAERGDQRAVLRDESVHFLFKCLGVLPNSEAVNQQFSKAYQQVKIDLETVDREHLGELADLYEDHPVIRVFKTLEQTSPMHKEDIVFMRRSTLLLLEGYSS